MYKKNVRIRDLAFRYGLTEKQMQNKFKAKIPQEQKYIYMEVIDDIYKWRLSQNKKVGD